MRHVIGQLAACALLVGCSDAGADGSGAASPSIAANLALSPNGGEEVVVRNTGSSPFVLQKIIINAQEGDSDCDIKLFVTVEAGQRRNVPAPRCGKIHQVLVATDAGNQTFEWAAGEELYAFTSYDSQGPKLHLTNATERPFSVDSIVVNNRGSDSDCNVKFFYDIPALTAHEFALPSCGQIRSVEVLSGDRVVSFNFD